GVLALTYFFGAGVLVNIIWASIVAISCEALMLKARGYKVSFFLKDYSAIVTATLLAIAIPPYAPYWIVLVGTAFSIIIGKHLYGGLGNNPFNPAMIGYVVLLISFPIQMTSWAAPINTLPDQPANLGIFDAIAVIFGFAADGVDAFTMATPLDILKQNSSLLVSDVTSSTSNRGKIIYGGMIGTLLYLIRMWGNYPDAIAFAVLLANFTAPLIDYYVQPRTYGHAKGSSKDKVQP
ncbi:MAG: RnfABCDGE type electron transport complex subunit D, partial [Sinobacterium sp.]